MTELFDRPEVSADSLRRAEVNGYRELSRKAIALAEVDWLNCLVDTDIIPLGSDIERLILEQYALAKKIGEFS